MSHNVLNVLVGVKLHADVKSFFGFSRLFKNKVDYNSSQMFYFIVLRTGDEGTYMWFY